MTHALAYSIKGKYDVNKVIELVRFIRNMCSYRLEQSVVAQKDLASFPKGFDAYFSERFLTLLMDFYEVVRTYC